jgi:hypothetical protein
VSVPPSLSYDLPYALAVTSGQPRPDSILGIDVGRRLVILSSFSHKNGLVLRVVDYHNPFVTVYKPTGTKTKIASFIQDQKRNQSRPDSGKSIKVETFFGQAFRCLVPIP